MTFSLHMDRRAQLQERDYNGPTGVTLELITQRERAMRHSVRDYLHHFLSERFHMELHDLATGGSHLLRQLMGWEKPLRDGDFQDDIPF